MREGMSLCRLRKYPAVTELNFSMRALSGIKACVGILRISIAGDHPREPPPRSVAINLSRSAIRGVNAVSNEEHVLVKNKIVLEIVQ